jgi:hypothetical protein
MQIRGDIERAEAACTRAEEAEAQANAAKCEVDKARAALAAVDAALAASSSSVLNARLASAREEADQVVKVCSCVCSLASIPVYACARGGALVWLAELQS